MTERRVTDERKAHRKTLLKLLHLLLRRDCTIAACDSENVRIERGGEIANFTPGLLAFAVSRGLVVRSGTAVAATTAAPAFLRRMLANEEEAFAGQHREMVEDVALLAGVHHKVRRNLKESPLAPLARLKERDGEPFLSEAAFDAGDRLADDFNRGQMQPRITASWEPRLNTNEVARGAAGGEISDSAMAARGRFARAVEAMGPELSGVAMDVCCFGKGLETVERERLWPARSAKLMLRAALLALARHYAPPPSRGTRPHHWGDGDFRPRM